MKKQLDDTKRNLQESNITWASELQQIYNSREHYKTLQLQKKYFYEKNLQTICTLLSSANCLASYTNSSTKGTLDLQKVKHLEQDFTFETLTTTYSQFNSSITSIQEKIKRFMDPSVKPGIFQELSSVDEKNEVSYDTNIELSMAESVWTIKPVTSRVETENNVENSKSHRETSLNQPEEEQIEEINGLIEGFEFTTNGDQVITGKELGVSYIIRDDCEGREDTLNYTRNEVPVMRKTWKYFICPCIFKNPR